MFRIVSPILSILIAIAAFFFFVRPVYFELQETRSETRAYGEALANARQYNAKLQELLSKKNSFSALELDRLEAMIPQRIDGVRSLVDIERLATSHGLLFDHVTINLQGEGEGTEEAAAGIAGQTENGLDTLDISFSVVGTYAQFKSFLESIERSLMLMDVTAIAFQTAEGELISYSVTVRLYGYSETP